MRPIGDIEHDIDNNRKNLVPLLHDNRRLTEELRTAKAEEFIRVNSITIDDIELVDQPNNEWFGTVDKFIDKVLKRSTKRFAEWNGTIYFRTDLVGGRMPDMPACIEDL